MALRLARPGSFLYVNFNRNETAAREALAKIRELGGDGELCRFDVADHHAVQEAVKRIIAERGHIDTLINNAGIWMGGLIVRIKESLWDQVIDTNLKGTFNCCQAVTRHMIRRRSGRIINVSSLIGEAGNAGDSVYAAAKGGIIGLTKSLARELGSRNICVNAVAPGLIETDMTAAFPADAKKELEKEIPLGRLGSPEDVAGLVAFLASEAAAYITGQVIRVNGGLYM
ncbi:MAG: 3-oxoacyl-[acyl-carrier protein] reductase [Thermodesulfobacteriota bacterium]|nr:3-oxoacyl-[acyl-carrier protein] reductase [Thermodesulfobacteriota bacterium]